MTIAYAGSPTTLTSTALQSLADDAYWQSDGQDNAVDVAESVDVEVTIVTTTSVGDLAGYVDVFMSSSVDGGSTYSGLASGSEGTYAPSPSADDQSRSLDYLGRVHCRAEETTARTYRKKVNIVPLFKLPKRYSIVIVNRTGQALASSGNTVKLLKNTVS